jgi:hypothetical protein
MLRGLKLRDQTWCTFCIRMISFDFERESSIKDVRMESQNKTSLVYRVRLLLNVVRDLTNPFFH